MDWVAFREKLRALPRKYPYMILSVLAGILLMTWPQPKQKPVESTVQEGASQESLEQSLEEILGRVSGAGRVEVLLSVQEGECVLYQTDEILGPQDTRRDTVLVTDADRRESGLVRQVKPPVYRGAVIVCQGAENPRVKLSVVEAVKSVTGLSADRITVLKMK